MVKGINKSNLWVSIGSCSIFCDLTLDGFVGEEHSDRTSGTGPETPDRGRERGRRRHDTAGGVHQRTGETGE